MKLPVSEPGSSIKTKTGDWRVFKPVMDREKCVKCGICITFCPEGIINIEEECCKIDYDYCKGCGICAKECPKGAISMVEEKK